MAKNNYWIKGGLINIFQNIFNVLFGFIGFYILVRILTKEEYGTWVLFLSTVTIIEIGRNGLTQEALIKYLSSSNDEDKKNITTATFIINSITTIIIVCILLIVGPILGKSWHSHEINTMFHLYLIAFIFTGVSNQLNCIEQANLNFTGIFYSNFARQVIFFIYVFYCYKTAIKPNLFSLTYIQIISIFASLIIAYIYTRKKLEYAKVINWDWVKKIFNFGKFTFGISLSTILAGSIDQMMLGSLLSKAASGSFNIAVRITNLTDIPTNSMVAIVYPQSSIKIINEGEKSVKYLYEKSVGVILAILMPVILFTYLFADFIIPFIAGSKYADAIPLLKVTLIGAVFSPYGRQAGAILNSAGKTKFNFLIVVATATLIIIFNFIFINHFGVVGAAYGTLLATFISFVISQIYLRKFYNTSIISPWIYAYKFYPEFYNKYVKKSKIG